MTVDQLVQHGQCARGIVIHAQKLRFQQLDFERIRGDPLRVLEFLFGCCDVPTGNGQLRAGYRRLQQTGGQDFRFGVGLFRLVQLLEGSVGLAAYDKDQGVDNRVLALYLELLQRIGIFS